MNDSYENTLTFIPGARIVLHDADTVELRTGVWNCSSVTLADDEQRGVLGKVVLGLLDGQSIAAIAQKAGIRVEDISSVVETLAANNVLVPRESISKWSRLSYLATPTLGSMHGMGKTPRQVIVLGPAVMTNFFRTAAGTLLTDKLFIENTNKLECLRRKDLLLGADGLRTSDAVAPFIEWQDALIVVVWSELDPILLGNLNRLAHRVKFNLLMAVVDGPFAIIGPTIVPGITACYACAEARVLESLRDHTLYVDYRAALSESRVYGSADIEMDPFQAATLSLAAWEATNMMTLGSAFTSNKLLSIYAPTMEVMFHELLRMPGCPVCSTRSALDQPLYTDLRSYLSKQLG